MKCVIAFIIAWTATFAEACPVCGFGQDGSSTAFVLTSVLLTMAPLLMLGGLYLYLRSLARGNKSS